MPKKSSLQVRLDTLQLKKAEDTKINTHSPKIRHEIQCPHCHDMMTSSSEFDRLDYFCKQCNFLLCLPKEWAEKYLRVYQSE